VARRITKLSATFRRSIIDLGILPRSPAYRAVFATLAVLADAEELPGPADHETRFGVGHLHVRRVGGLNVWILYNFDDAHVFAVTTRGEPPVPLAD
jgi:hypothetical protein